MRKTLTLISCISLLAVAPVHAAETSKPEKVGIGAGAVVGAIAGGPVGFIIGGAIGAKIGDTMHQKNESIDELSTSLQRSNNDLRNLNTNYDTVNGELERMQQVSRPEDTTGDRLARLGATLASMSDVQVRLDGFADERGDETYNYELSAQRVAFVRDQLIAVGIHPSRIQTSAHGEVPAQDATADSYALERRVSLTLFIDDAQSVAQLP
jgi:hypothetical protein